MSSGHWRVGAALAGLALLYVVLWTGAFFGALNAPHYGDQPPHLATNQNQDDPPQIGRDRAGLPYFAARIASGPDAKNSTERENRDLAAQESMSVWAFWMMLVSAVGTVTTMFGTGFLLWQIMLTRKAVKDSGDATSAMNRANEIAEKSQRPWIAIEEIEVRQHLWHRDANVSIGSAINMKMRNTGSRPAIDVSCEVTSLEGISHAATDMSELLKGMQNRSLINPVNIAPHGTYPFEHLSLCKMPDFNPEEGISDSTVLLIVSILYKDGPGNTYHQTGQGYFTAKQTFPGNSWRPLTFDELNDAPVVVDGRFSGVLCALVPRGGVMN